jgi:protein-disulfide isomerase/uncharacterized membrane protein
MSFVMKEPGLGKLYLWGVILFSVLGGVLSYYSTNLTYQLALTGLVDPSGCSVNEWISCDAVLATRFAKMFGIPVAWFGFLYYLIIAFFALLSVASKDIKRSTASIAVALILTIGAVLFSFYKAYQLITMQVLCPVCIGMYIANFAILILLIKSRELSFKNTVAFLISYLKSVFGRKSRWEFPHQPIVYAIFITWVFIIGYTGVYFFERSLPKPEAFNLEEALAEHFEQTPIDIKVDSGAAYRGNPEAGVSIVEFSDFECPSCAITAFQLTGLLLEYRNDVILYFMNYPLDKSINENLKFDIHKNAGLAALAGVCAQKHGDFWSYHDALFNNQKEIDREFLIQLAKKQGWDTEEFSKCMDAEETMQRVLSDIQEGTDIKVLGTPFIYINGRRVIYWNNLQFIRAVIKEELRK